MKILITGANGQLGSEFKELLGKFPNLNFSFKSKEEFNICKFSENEIKNFDAIVNCAAFTAVDKAESTAQEAFLINEKGVLNLAKICKKMSVKLVHISTDYVFGGMQNSNKSTKKDENSHSKQQIPFSEDMPTNPINAYGASKLAGEKAILAQNLPNSAIIRTSWLYGKMGANFVKTIIRLAREKSEISVVSDQFGSPTNAADLAEAICEILPNLNGENTQIYHYSNEGAISWYEFAAAIVKILGFSCVIKPIKTSDYPTPAKRPFYSVLNTSKIKTDFSLKIPQWRESLEKFLNENFK